MQPHLQEVEQRASPNLGLACQRATTAAARLAPGAAPPAAAGCAALGHEEAVQPREYRALGPLGIALKGRP